MHGPIHPDSCSGSKYSRDERHVLAEPGAVLPAHGSLFVALLPVGRDYIQHSDGFFSAPRVNYTVIIDYLVNYDYTILCASCPSL